MATDESTKAKHTPGPWTFNRRHVRKTSNFDQTYRVGIYGPPVDGHSDLVAYAIGFTREEAIANAELIALAPALLARLASPPPRTEEPRR